LSGYLNRIITNPAYNRIRKDVERLLKRIPRFGFRAYRAARRLEEGLKNLLVPGMLFEEMGFRYFGPIEGHKIADLVGTFRNLMSLNEPLLIHVVTKKGKGYKFAEERPSDFHGTGPFDIATGEKTGSVGGKTFTEAFGEKMVELAAKDERIIGITAAMVDGTGLNDFARLFPARFFDVGISEEHAVTFSAGLARSGFKPVVAVYSTFLQRGYDQITHDICLQNLGVVFCLDRAGLVGEDGPTHHGVFDIAYLRHMPNLILMAPKDAEELKAMLEFAIRQKAPVAIRYPKGESPSLSLRGVSPIELGRSEILRKGKDVAIIALGSMVPLSLDTASLLAAKDIKTMVVNARFVKPVDEVMLEEILASIKKIVTLEEGVLESGFGSAVLEFIEKEGLKGTKMKRIGLPSRFIEHGKRGELFTKYNLTADAVCDVIVNEVMK
jgi:1-deoxy-D-xylulose-5-phosphate synthase